MAGRIGDRQWKERELKHLVVIFGGGVAGLSAAQELAERGFEVQVFEKRAIPGGKARSFSKPDSGTGGRPDLPAEHGFRFFPRFYRHVTDTMKRIPYADNPYGVFDNLVQLTRMEVPRLDSRPFLMPARFPRGEADLHMLLQDIFENLHGELGLEAEEVEFFAGKIWRVLTMCEERRRDELERLSWWDYLGAEGRSEGYQKFLAQGLSKFLVAADARVVNAKVEGDIVIQLLLGLAEPGVSLDRVLNGPTQDVWIDPWCRYLKEDLNVSFHFNTPLRRLYCDETGDISHAEVLDPSGHLRTVLGDYYLLALPVEVTAEVLRTDPVAKSDGEFETHNVLKHDPSLTGVVELGEAVGWMNGLQFYLRKNLRVIVGHELYLDSKWALTSISQGQIWPQIDLRQYGDGSAVDILSVVISEWNTPGAFVGKPAKECSRRDIRREVWEQMKYSLRDNGIPLLTEADYHSWYLDPDIKDQDRPGAGVSYKDTEPLFVALNNTWHLRPDAYTRIPNLFLAADYVRTNTQLATMEAANEAARRAVNSILDAAGSTANHCRIWPLHEPDVLAVWRWHDRRRYIKGLPWKAELPGLIQRLGSLVLWFAGIWRALQTNRLMRRRPAAT